ncbi:RagB/SusD family nutrient uptake outer membrane protein [Chitinophaga sp. 212800010-3]|uniref:RagB/SusD family nutrient uptake outer membrane protein n=1 Tax=unclassified Chitinophaga TaxID=2619133 RepID=UPI003FA440AD
MNNSTVSTVRLNLLSLLPLKLNSWNYLFLLHLFQQSTGEYHERRVGLAFEGIYYSDIRRWGNGAVIRTIAGQQVEAGSFVDALYLWLIPQGEMDLNPKLTLNPGY